jgi:hypothetical protein
MKWKAIYNDNSEHTEEALGNTEKIDRNELKEFILLKDDKVFFKAFFDKERKLIFRRRTFLNVDGSIKGLVYLIGWHSNINGKSVKSICYVYDDGHVEFDDARDDIQLVPCELC